MNIKKLLIYAGLFMAAFAVINTGMYFFLRATQPKSAATHLASAPSDSLGQAGSARVEPTTKMDGAPDTLTGRLTADVPVGQIQPTPSAQAADTMTTPVDTRGSSHSLANAEATVISDSSQTDSTAAMHSTLQSARTGDTKELTKLAKLMDSMKPKEAAAIASGLDTDTIVALVMKMKERSAAKFMAALPSDQAGRVAARMSEMAIVVRDKL
jgi:hypothetical protein